MKPQKQESYVPEWTIIRAFFSSYKILSFIFFASLSISIFYSCSKAFKWPEAFPGDAALFDFLNNLSLALIANTIFCYFQVHRPDYLRKIKIQKTVCQSLFQIKHLMSFRIEHIYQQKYGEHIAFQDIPADKLGSLFSDMFPKESCAVKTYNEDIEKCECLTNLEAICLSCVEITDLCAHLFSYASDLNEDVLSILEQVYKSFFVSFFRTHIDDLKFNSSWCDYFLFVQDKYTGDYQKAYIRLIQYLEKTF